MILDPDFGVHASRPDGPHSLYRAVIARAVLDLFGKVIPAPEGVDSNGARREALSRHYISWCANVVRGQNLDAIFAERAASTRMPYASISFASSVAARSLALIIARHSGVSTRPAVFGSKNRRPRRAQKSPKGAMRPRAGYHRVIASSVRPSCRFCRSLAASRIWSSQRTENTATS